MSLPPVEIPLGAMRFNSDSQKLEYFNGDVWMQIHTFSPNLGGNGGPAGNPTGNSADQVAGARGLFMGGSPSPNGNTVEYITIPTAGNAIDFADMTENRKYCSAFSSNTRGVVAGGENPSGKHDEIEYVTIATTGILSDFGNLLAARTYVGCASNQTRGLIAGGYTGSADYDKVIQYVTIASQGIHAKTFGELTVNNSNQGGTASPTRAVFAGGASWPSIRNVIEYVTIATLGDSHDFGDLIAVGCYNNGASSSTRAVYAGSSHNYKMIEYLTFATKGNTINFGELTSDMGWAMGTSDTVRGVFGGGQNPVTTAMDYINVATQGNAVDFGTLITDQHLAGGACSSNHGGLG